MMVRSGRARFRGLLAVATLMIGPILSACSSPTVDVVAKITSPAPNSNVKVGEQIQLEGLVTGAGITQVDVVINNTPYAQLTVQDKDKAGGVSNFPIAAGQVPWTPPTPGLYALQLIVYKGQNELLKKSEPVLITAVPAGEAAAPTADSAAAASPPTAPPPAANQPTAAAPGSTAAPGAPSGGPSLTVVNEFVNVRKGPGVGYDKVGQLNKGQSAPVKGKSADGEWLQITFSGASNGLGWVKQRDGSDALVQANDAAKGVAVAAAPPLPTSEPIVQAPAAPAAPSGNVAIVPLVPVATAPAVALPTAIPQGNLTGGAGIIRLSANPVGSGGSVNVSWNIPSFKDGDFDAADGRGFTGPILGAMNINLTNVTSARTVTVRWHDLSGAQKTDSVTIQVLGVAAVATANTSDCNVTNKDWQGGNTNYPFCVAGGLGWIDNNVKEIADFNPGEDRTLTAVWNIYGINGIRFVVAPSSYCGPPGDGAKKIDRAASGNGRESININALSYGSWEVYLAVTRRDGVTVNYNSKYLCIGTRTGVQPTATSTSVAAPTATPTPVPIAIPTDASTPAPLNTNPTETPLP